MRDNLLLKDIGTRIKNKRKELNMTQEKLAELMDVSIQMISNLEQGKKAIRPENIVKICNVLNVSSDYILRGQYSEHETSKIFQKFNMLTSEKKRLLEDLIDELSK